MFSHAKQPYCVFFLDCLTSLNMVVSSRRAKVAPLAMVYYDFVLADVTFSVCFIPFSSPRRLSLR